MEQAQNKQAQLFRDPKIPRKLQRALTTELETAECVDLVRVALLTPAVRRLLTR